MRKRFYIPPQVGTRFSDELQKVLEAWLYHCAEAGRVYNMKELQTLVQCIRTLAVKYGDHAVAILIHEEIEQGSEQIRFFRLREVANA